MAHYGDGVERPFLDKQGHSPDCKVWTAFENRFLCNCGAVEPPAPRVIPGFSDYEISVDGTVKQLSTGRVLQITNAQRVARIRDDDGEFKSRRISRIIDDVYLDLAHG